MDDVAIDLRGWTGESHGQGLRCGVRALLRPQTQQPLNHDPPTEGGGFRFPRGAHRWDTRDDGLEAPPGRLVVRPEWARRLYLKLEGIRRREVGARRRGGYDEC